MAFDLDQFRKTLLYEAEDTISDIQSHIDEMRDMDIHFETLERRWKYLGCGGCLMIPLSFVGGIALSSLISEAASGIAMLVGLGIGIVAAVVGFIAKWVTGRKNIENKRYELLHRTLGMLVRDMPKDTKVKAKLDMRPRNHKLKRTGKEKRQKGWRTWTVSLYDDPWLTLDGRLLDGTKFRLQMEEKYQHWIWRGKKTKVKEKSNTLATLILRIKPEKHPMLEKVALDGSEAVQLPEGVIFKRFIPTEASLMMKTSVKVPWNVPPPAGQEVAKKKGQTEAQVAGHQMVAMMFLSLFQILNLSRMVGKSEGSGS